MSIRQPKKNNHHGFTLIEIVVVMLIISLVLSVAVVMFSRFNEKHSLLSKAQNTVSLLQFCHRYAMFNQTDIHFVFNHKGYILEKQSSNKQFYHWSPFSQSQAHFSYLRFQWDASSLSTSSKTLIITFHSDGTVSAPIKKIPFTIHLLFNDTPTEIAISVSTQGGISVLKKGRKIEG